MRDEREAIGHRCILHSSTLILIFRFIVFKNDLVCVLARAVAFHFLADALIETGENFRPPLAQLKQALVAGVKLKGRGVLAHLVFLHVLMCLFSKTFISLWVILAQLDQILVMRIGRWLLTRLMSFSMSFSHSIFLVVPGHLTGPLIHLIT
jgi:hypothetical protein